LPQRNLEPDVAHHGGNDRISLEPPFCLHLLRTHQHHRVAVDDTSAGIDEDRAIAIAVIGDPHLTPAVDHRACEQLGRGGAASEIDVAAVRRAADAGRVVAELPEQRRRHRRRCAVGTVDDDPS
jgi:hypothetical protein